MAQASAEKLERTGPAEKESDLSESNWKERQSRPYQNEKSRQSKAPDHEGGESQGGSEREHEVERVDSTVKEGRFQGGQARRSSLE